MNTFLVIAFVIVISGVAVWLTARPGISPGIAEGQSVEAAKRTSLSAIENFTPAIIYDGLAGSYGLAIDPNTHKFAISIPGSSARVYHYTQLVAAEVDRDGTTITTPAVRLSRPQSLVLSAAC